MVLLNKGNCKVYRYCLKQFTVCCNGNKPIIQCIHVLPPFSQLLNWGWVSAGILQHFCFVYRSEMEKWLLTERLQAGSSCTGNVASGGRQEYIVVRHSDHTLGCCFCYGFSWKWCSVMQTWGKAQVKMQPALLNPAGILSWVSWKAVRASLSLALLSQDYFIFSNDTAFWRKITRFLW